MVNKTPRSASTRDKEARTKHWQLPSSLDTPTPPEGYKFRWIRESVRGYEANKNVIGRIRPGYELVRADEYPERDLPTIDDGKYAGIIGTGGLVLARMPLETVEERNDYYRGRTREQMTAVDSDLMKEQHPSMPITNDRQTRVSFGGRNDSSNN